MCAPHVRTDTREHTHMSTHTHMHRVAHLRSSRAACEDAVCLGGCCLSSPVEGVGLTAGTKVKVGNVLMVSGDTPLHKHRQKECRQNRRERRALSSGLFAKRRARGQRRDVEGHGQGLLTAQVQSCHRRNKACCLQPEHTPCALAQAKAHLRRVPS